MNASFRINLAVAVHLPSASMPQALTQSRRHEDTRGPGSASGFGVATAECSRARRTLPRLRYEVGPSDFWRRLLCHCETTTVSRRSIGQPRPAKLGPAVRCARSRWDAATLRLRFVPSRRVARPVLYRVPAMTPVVSRPRVHRRDAASSSVRSPTTRFPSGSVISGWTPMIRNVFRLSRRRCSIVTASR
jgi:hypothetical protein